MKRGRPTGLGPVSSPLDPSLELLLALTFCGSACPRVRGDRGGGGGEEKEQVTGFAFGGSRPFGHVLVAPSQEGAEKAKQTK